MMTKDQHSTISKLKKAGFNITDAGVFRPRDLDELERFPEKLVAYRRGTRAKFIEVGRGYPVIGDVIESSISGCMLLLMEHKRASSENTKSHCLAYTNARGKRIDDMLWHAIKVDKPTAFLWEGALVVRKKREEGPMYDSGEYPAVKIREPREPKVKVRKPARRKKRWLSCW